MSGSGTDEKRAAPSTPAALATGLILAGLALELWGATPLNAQAQSEAMTYEGKPHRFTLTLPAGCRHEQGPGTLDAVCAPDLDPEKSAVATAASALVLAAAAESVDSAPDTSIAGLLQRYTEAAFRKELPEAVCGEQDQARVKIENLSQSVEGERLVYTADVTCAQVKFLHIEARRAVVRHVIGPDAVYRLVARAPVDVFEKQRPTIDAFFASFRLAAIERAEK